MTKLFETDTGTIHIAVRPFFHTVTNPGKHDVTVEAISSDPTLLGVSPRTQTIAPGKSADFDLLAEGVSPGSCTVTFSSGSERVTVKVELSANPTPLGHCFAADTLVLLGDGTTRAISQLEVGDTLLTVDEMDHLVARPAATTATVEAVLRHDTEHAMLELGGLVVTGNHRWAVRTPREPGFVMTRALEPANHELLALVDCRVAAPSDRKVAWLPVPDATPAATLTTVWNLTTSARSYAVATTPSGPFFVVHNSKPDDPNDGIPDEPPLNKEFLKGN